MKAIIEKSQASNKRQSVVYLESVLTKVADEFAMKHNIYGAPFRSKVWEKVCRTTNKLQIAALRNLFPETKTIRFSHKAGCSCGCSPGFVIKHDHPNQFGRTYWVKLEASETEVADLKSQFASSTLDEEVAAERAAYQNK